MKDVSRHDKRLSGELIAALFFVRAHGEAQSGEPFHERPVSLLPEK